MYVSKQSISCCLQGDGVAQTCGPVGVRSQPAREWCTWSSPSEREEIHRGDPSRDPLHTSIQDVAKTTFVSSY